MRHDIPHQAREMIESEINMPKEKKILSDETPSPENTLGGRMQAARDVRGLSVKQLAHRAGVSPKTLANWESDSSEPRANKLQMLAGVLRVPMMWLLGGDTANERIDVETNVAEIANFTEKVELLLELHQQSAKLIFELDSEARRLQSRIDDASIQL